MRCLTDGLEPVDLFQDLVDGEDGQAGLAVDLQIFLDTKHNCETMGNTLLAIAEIYGTSVQ